MEKTIYRYVVKYSLPQQILLTLIAFASFPFLYAFYELPKMIVNDVIQAKDGDYPVEFFGTSFNQIEFLFFLCGGFLALVVVNQSFKYVINVYSGQTGERMLRRLRYDLYRRVLRFPLPHFRKISPGEIITMITAEVEPLGGFIADAFKLPIFQGGYLIVILTFLMIQNWVMAVAAIALYPLQFYIIPKLQRRVNEFGKERVRLVRRLSDRISETVSGIEEVHANDASAYEKAGFSHRLGQIYEVRLRIFIWKFIIKFLNNSINQLGPFCFYAIGGYLVIGGDLQIGTLMAAIAAHKDLAAPWKELLNFYQRREDARIKYDQVTQQFNPPEMLDEALQESPPETVEPLRGEIAAAGLSLQDDTGGILVDSVSLSFPWDHHVAVVGLAGSGRENLAALLARISFASSGQLAFGGTAANRLHEAVTGRRIAYVGASATVFAATVRDNLLYGLKHRVTREAPEPEDEKANQRRLTEALASGNTTDDLEADWIDYEAALGETAATEITGAEATGAEATDGPKQDDLRPRLFETLKMVDLENDVYEFGLRVALDPRTADGLAERLLEARTLFRERLADPEIASQVESFDIDCYNTNATVAENLLFGAPVDDIFNMDRLAENPYVLEVLEKQELTDAMLEAGLTLATTMIELFSDLPPGHEFFEQFSFIGSDDLPVFQALLSRISEEGVESLSAEEKTQILSLPFKLQPSRHRLGIIDDAMQERLLSARHYFAENIPESLRDSLIFFDAEKYSPSSSIQDNILFGKVVYGQAGAANRVHQLIVEVIDSLGLRDEITMAGMELHAGIGGGRLSAVQRQKLALARAVLKRPDILVLNDATASLDAVTQTRIMDNLLREFEGRGVIWSLHRADLARQFKQVVVMRSGRIEETGSFEEIDREGSALQALLNEQ